MASAGGRPAGSGLSRRRERLLTAALVVFSMGFSVLLLECGVRVYKRDVAYQPDPEVLRSLLPHKELAILSFETEDNLNGRSREIPERPRRIGTKRTNNLGLRMSRDIGPRAPGERRILLLGDSFTEALEVRQEARFGDLLDRRLATADTGPVRWRVVNGGIQNGSPSQYVLQLRRFLPLLEPDLVVVVTGANDLFDDSKFEREHGFVRDADGLPLAPRARWRLWWLQKSYLLRYGQVFVQAYLPGAYDFFFPPVNGQIEVPDWVTILCSESPAARARFEESTGTYLRGLKHLAEASGVEFAVLIIHYLYGFADEPFYEPRFPTVKQKLVAAGCYENQGAPFNEFIEAFLRRHGIRFRNTHAALAAAKRAAPDRKLWHFYDYHFSEVGHQLVARELYELVAPVLERSASRASDASPGR